MRAGAWSCRGRTTANGGRSWHVLLPLADQCQGRTEASEKGENLGAGGRELGRPSPTLCQWQTEGNKGLWQTWPPNIFRPFFPVVSPLLLHVAGRLCHPWDRSHVCDFQEVSLERRGIPSALSSSVLLAELPAAILSNDATLAMKTTPSRSIRKKETGSLTACGYQTSPGVFTSRLPVHEQKMHVCL